MYKITSYLIFSLITLSLLVPLNSIYAQADVDAAKAALDDARQEQDDAWDAVEDAIGTDGFEDAVDEWKEKREAVKEAEINYDRAVDTWIDAMSSANASSGMGTTGDYAILAGILVAIGLSIAILIRQK